MVKASFWRLGLTSFSRAEGAVLRQEAVPMSQMLSLSLAQSLSLVCCFQVVSILFSCRKYIVFMS